MATGKNAQFRCRERCSFDKQRSGEHRSGVAVLVLSLLKRHMGIPSPYRTRTGGGEGRILERTRICVFGNS